MIRYKIEQSFAMAEATYTLCYTTNIVYTANFTRSHINVRAVILTVKILTSHTANDHSGEGKWDK